MTLNIGLIGLGRHGLRYATHLLEPLPAMRLVAVCRRDAVAGRVFATQHGLRFYEDYQDLVADPDVHAVVVVTPASETEAIGQAAIRARKPLLIEKPLADSAHAAHRIADAAEAARVPLMTAHTLRFDSAIAALKSELHRVGPLRYGVLTLRLEARDVAMAGGLGVLMEIGVHCFDLIRYLTGEEVADVQCNLDSHDDGPESMAFARMATAATARPFLVDVSRVSATRIGRIEWIGEKGQLMADWSRGTFTRLIAGEPIETSPIQPRPTLVAALSAFAEAITTGRPVPITGRDGQRAVELAQACARAAATGMSVRVHA